MSSAIADSEAFNAPYINSIFASLFPADIHGKIPQIIKNKSACLFCVHQRGKIIQSDFYWEIIAPKERHYYDPG